MTLKHEIKTPSQNPKTLTITELIDWLTKYQKAYGEETITDVTHLHVIDPMGTQSRQIMVKSKSQV